MAPGIPPVRHLVKVASTKRKRGHPEQRHRPRCRPLYGAVKLPLVVVLAVDKRWIGRKLSSEACRAVGKPFANHAQTLVFDDVVPKRKRGTRNAKPSRSPPDLPQAAERRTPESCHAPQTGATPPPIIEIADAAPSFCPPVRCCPPTDGPTEGSAGPEAVGPITRAEAVLAKPSGAFTMAALARFTTEDSAIE